MTAQSAQILDYLRTVEKPFTSRDVKETNPHISHGAVSGFIARLKEVGAITIDSYGTSPGGRSVEVYRVVDLSGIETRNKSSRGGIVGRQVNGRTKREKLVSVLFHVVEELDTMKLDLSDFSTKELLKELERRAG